MSTNAPKTNKEVTKAWSESVGRPVNFELHEVEAADGRKQTQLYNLESGSLVVAVNATGDEAVERLVREAGSIFIDDAFTQPEIDGPNKANQLDKSDSNVRTPASNPGAAVEAEKTENSDKLAEDVSKKPAKAAKKPSEKSDEGSEATNSGGGGVAKRAENKVGDQPKEAQKADEAGSQGTPNATPAAKPSETKE